MKGLILAAGLGTRLRPITSLRPKPLISVANRPLIRYAVQNLVDAGITDIGVVVSHETIRFLQQALAGYQGASFTFITQDPPRGLAHAVEVAREFLADDPFVMYLGDNLFEHGISKFIEAFRPDAGVNAVMALVTVEDPRQLGVAVVEDGRITDLIEKPEHPPSNLAVAGVYVFDHNIHAMIDGLEPGAKGEYQITDAIHRLIQRGYHVAPVAVDGWWKDTGNAEDILDANRLQLMQAQRNIAGDVQDSNVVGEVVIEAGARVTNSTIFGPALIASGAVIEGSYLGPFTTIGDDVVIRNAELEYSVVGARTKINDIHARIRESLIGEDVHLTGRHERPSSHRLVLGDMSDVQLQDG
jgi:glucose-1-phosphate thymidylyltransferase